MDYVDAWFKNENEVNVVSLSSNLKLVGPDFDLILYFSKNLKNSYLRKYLK